MDGRTALIQAHHNNIGRYRRLLETRLTDVERRYIEARLCEEQAALLSCVHPHDGPASPAARA